MTVLIGVYNGNFKAVQLDENGAITLRDRGAGKPFNITPNDSQPLAVVPDRVFVGTAGHVKLRGVDGTEDVIYKNCAAGSYIDVRPLTVYATGTTASDLIGEV